MRIAILAAMEKERALLLPLLENRRDEDYEGLTVSVGRIGRHEVGVARCGIGKVNSAINAYKCIRGFGPQLVVNSGVAGGAGATRIGDLLVADYVSYHDVWCGPETDIGAADGMDVFIPCDRKVIDIAYRLYAEGGLRVGLICSGDRFITTREEVDAIKAGFPEVMAIDMESASIGQVCAMCGTPFNIIRVVSDTPGDGENVSQYANFWSDAPERTFNAVRGIIESLD